MDYQTADRIGEYFLPYLDEYIFDELSDGYLKKSNMEDVLKGVPVPINKKELTELSNLKIAHSMAMVMGCDMEFKYREEYKKYIDRSFGKDFIMPLLNEGIEYAARGDFERASICFRGALAIDPDNSDALYCLGRALKDAYENGDGEEYVGRFKAESLETFEKLTIIAPDFDMGYYYLGYGYLNLGLYMKAKLTFQEFLKLADVLPEETSEIPLEVMEEKEELIREVKDWVEKLETPVEIESAYNKILSGRYVEGIEGLLPYTKDSQYMDWWPLYYYLGYGHKNLEEWDEAISNYKRVLELAPSDIKTMEELAEIYDVIGDNEKREKYLNKIKIVQENMEKEKAERNKSFS